MVDGKELARLAQIEIGRYRELDNDFRASVLLRDDMASGIMVSKDQLFVSTSARVRKQRAVGLLHHEIGTHLVTYFNGQAQPFQQLYARLAGYESLQEGIAVPGEFLVGGLTLPRVRILAARVIACRSLTVGNTFQQKRPPTRASVGSTRPIRQRRNPIDRQQRSGASYANRRRIARKSLARAACLQKAKIQIMRVGHKAITWCNELL